MGAAFLFAMNSGLQHRAGRIAATVHGGGEAAKKANVRSAVKKIALSAVKDDLSRYLRLAEKEDIVITRHGKAAGVLIGFKSEDEWFEYRMQNDPRFLRRVEAARNNLRRGKGVRLEDLEE